MILIAGGKGFIGTRLCKLFDSLDVGLYETADLKDGIDVCDIKDTSAYDVIVLLAANLKQDITMMQDNLAICKWAMRQSAHIIYTSSAAVYPDQLKPHTETDPTKPSTFYGVSKLVGERLIKMGNKNYTILRLANVYGDGDGNGAIDIFKRGGTTIYGNGSDIRDYVPVEVVVEAIKTIALNPSAYNRETYNISSNMPMTTRAAFASFSKPPYTPKLAPPRGFDVKCSILNNLKAKKAGLIYED